MSMLEMSQKFFLSSMIEFKAEFLGVIVFSKQIVNNTKKALLKFNCAFLYNFKW